MTSDEIKGKDAVELSTNQWLREVCIQLALLNEKQAIVGPPAPVIHEAQRAAKRRDTNAS